MTFSSLDEARAFRQEEEQRIAQLRKLKMQGFACGAMVTTAVFTAGIAIFAWWILKD